jgi:hypothetical protein
MEPKHVRLRVFLNRLAEAPPAESFDEAFQQIADILNTVEDELTDIPFDPDQWQSDGRIYPPQRDSERPLEDHANIRMFRSRSHRTLIGANGSIEIQATNGSVVFSKTGADGFAVWD